MGSSTAVIATRRLTKRYGDFCAVNDLELNVREGEIYGFLGRNGAGKTTTIRMVLGLIRPTSGEVLLRGKPLRAGDARSLVGVGSLVESATAYPNLTVRENLDLQRRHRPPRSSVDRPSRLAARALCDPQSRQALSNQRRLALARVVLGEPRLLVLDEPANALDPEALPRLRLLRRLAHARGDHRMSSHTRGGGARPARRSSRRPAPLKVAFGAATAQEQLEIRSPTAARWT
jgi:ABC-2 type transport system ATP-binding protein